MERKKRAAPAAKPRNDSRLDFQDIHRLYRPAIFRYLTRLVGGSEAEDLTQEVFLKVSRALKHFRGGSSLSTWIYRIATNTALDELRKPALKRTSGASRRERPIATRACADAGAEAVRRAEEGESAAESSLIRQEMFDCLRSYIDKLPPSQRTVIVLSVLEGMMNREIAEILGLSLETVKIRLHRGRAKLVQELEVHCGWYRDRRNRPVWDGKIL